MVWTIVLIYPWFLSLIQQSKDALPPSRSLWIGNIDSSLTCDDLYSAFAKFGQIDSIRLLPDKECAFVNYVNIDNAVDARDTLQGKSIGSSMIKIGYGKIDNNLEALGAQPTKSLCY